MGAQYITSFKHVYFSPVQHSFNLKVGMSDGKIDGGTVIGNIYENPTLLDKEV